MKYIFIFLLILVHCRGIGQDTVRHYSFGTAGLETVVKTFPWRDGFVIIGNTGEVGNGQSDIYLVITDTAFNPVEYRTIGEYSIEYAVDAEFDPADSSYYILSTFYNGFESQSYNLRVDKLNKFLQVEKTEKIKSSSNLVAVALFVDEFEFGILCREFSDVQSEDSYKYYFFNKSFIKTKEFKANMGYTVHQSDFLVWNSQFIYMVGESVIVDSLKKDLLLSKFSLNGQLLDTWSYGGAGTDSASSISESGDSTFVIVGSSQSFNNSPDFDAWVFQTGLSGELKWSEPHGYYPLTNNKDDFGVSSIKLDNGNYLLLGTTHTFGQGETDFHLFYLSDTGTYISGNSYGLENFEIAKHIIVTEDTLFLMSGVTNSQGAGQDDIFLVTTSKAQSGALKLYHEHVDTVSLFQSNYIGELGVSNGVFLTDTGDELVLQNAPIGTKFIRVYNPQGRMLYNENCEESFCVVPKAIVTDKGMIIVQLSSEQLTYSVHFKVIFY